MGTSNISGTTDTVGKLGWSVDIRTHRINDVIDRLLIPDWDKSDPPTTPVPPPPSSSEKEMRSSWWGWGGGGKDKEDGGGDEDGEKGDDPEGGKKKKGGGVPEAKPEEDCADVSDTSSNVVFFPSAASRSTVLNTILSAPL